MSAAPITLRACATCAGMVFIAVEFGDQLYLRCADCHCRQLKFPLDRPLGALINIEETRTLAPLAPCPATASLLLKAYAQSAKELRGFFKQHPEVLS